MVTGLESLQKHLKDARQEAESLRQAVKEKTISLVESMKQQIEQSEKLLEVEQKFKSMETLMEDLDKQTEEIKILQAQIKVLKSVVPEGKGEQKAKVKNSRKRQVENEVDACSDFSDDENQNDSFLPRGAVKAYWKTTLMLDKAGRTLKSHVTMEQLTSQELRDIKGQLGPIGDSPVKFAVGLWKAIDNNN